MNPKTIRTPGPSWFPALGPYAPLATLLLITTAGLGAARLGLIVWKWQSVASLGPGTAGHILLQGLRSDLITAGWVLAPPILLLPLFVALRRESAWRALACLWLPTAALFLAFMELATPQFLIEYGVRPNRVFAEYLIYPKEVLAMIWGGYRYVLLLVLAAMGALGWAVFRHFRCYRAAAEWPRRRTLAVWPLVAFALLMMIRSNTHGRPVHLGNFAFCDNPLLNSLVANSAYTMLYSVYETKHETGLSLQYGQMPVPAMVASVRADMGVPLADFSSDAFPTLHQQTASVRRERPLNLILVLAESMGAKNVGRLGGRPLTPNLERLAEQSIWFEQLYATGTRTSRGLEAALAGFPPTPAQSVVRLPGAQKDFYTMATALREAGFHNEFVYGGDSNFDNRRRFALSNGFHEVIDRADYEEPIFSGFLGVCDEDLLQRVHERASLLHRDGRPFFLLALTLSNHPPFDFPDGRIEIDGEKHTAENTTRYADYAIGQFVQKARASEYWADTLVVVMADHEGHQVSDLLVPVTGFHIPGLILGADTHPLQIRSTASQIDIAPTLLSMLGVSGRFPFIGRDLTRTLPEFGNRKPPVRPRALMQYNQNFGWLEGNTLTVLSPDDADADAEGQARQFTFDPNTGALTPLSGADEPTVKRVLANALMPAWLYKEQRYQSDAHAPD